MVRDFHHFYNPSVWGQPAQFHAMLCKDRAIVIVHFITVAVPFMDCFCAINLVSPGGLVQDTRVRPQPQRAANVFHAALVWHQRNDGMGGIGV